MTTFFTKLLHPLLLTLATAIVVTAELRADERPSSRPSAEATKETISIVTTIHPLKLIVRDLIGKELQDRFEITALLPPNVSAHGFEPTAAQIARLHRANVVIYNGGGLDDWAGRGLPESVLAIRFADVSDTHHHHHDDEGEHTCCAHGHHHGPDDEHFWLDVELVKRFAAQCREDLAGLIRSRFVDASSVKVRLDHALDSFQREIDAVDQAFAETLKSYQRRRIVTHHNVFSRIAARYGLGDPLVLRPLATAEPTPRDLRRAIRTIRAERINAILTEPQFSPATAHRIRDETGVRLLSVDPKGGEANSWPELMLAIRSAIIQSFDAP